MPYDEEKILGRHVRDSEICARPNEPSWSWEDLVGVRPAAVEEVLEARVVGGAAERAVGGEDLEADRLRGLAGRDDVDEDGVAEVQDDLAVGEGESDAVRRWTHDHPFVCFGVRTQGDSLARERPDVWLFVQNVRVTIH